MKRVTEERVKKGKDLGVERRKKKERENRKGILRGKMCLREKKRK